MADFLTVDAFGRPPAGRIRWRRDLTNVIDTGIDGLHGATVNYANDGTHSLAPGLLPGGCALVAAWESADAAEAAFAGSLRRAIDAPGRARHLRGRLVEFLGNNLHAASRAAHHPGHRGSIDISSQLPYEHTSISLWKSYALAQDFAYKKGAHQRDDACTQAEDPSRRRLPASRPLAATGALGNGKPPYPQLPEARRAGI